MGLDRVQPRPELRYGPNMTTFVVTELGRLETLMKLDLI